MNRALDESNAVHCLGNGKICAYAKGLDWFEIFGSYYSAPTGVSLLFNGDRELCLETKRKPETAIWTYEVRNAKESLGTLTEFADSTDPIVYRNIKFHQPMSFQLVADQVEKFYFVPEETLQIKNFYYGEIPEGTSFCIYSIDGEKRRGFVTDKVLYFGFVATGDACVTKETLTLLNIQISDGTMALFYGEDFYVLVEYAQKVNLTDFSVHLQNAEAWWLACSANRKRNYSVADRELAEMIDDTYVLIKTQQSCSGGVLACYPYHLAYIRDNYGVNRGLLAMGAYDESKALLI